MKFTSEVKNGRAPKNIEALHRTKKQITSLVLDDVSNILAVHFPKIDCFKHSLSYGEAIFRNSLPRS